MKALFRKIYLRLLLVISLYSSFNFKNYKKNNKGEKLKVILQDIEKLGFTKSNETYIEIMVKGDVNDADYIRKTSRFNSLEEYIKVEEIFDKVLTSGDHNWKDTDYLSEEELELIEDYIPWLDNEEVHTIEDVNYTIVIDGILYK